MDSSHIRADSDPVLGPGGSKDFTTGAGSIGVIYTPADNYAIGISGAFTERAPTSQELFANGPHLATDAFEVGDRGLDVEKSLGADVFLRKKEGFVSGSIGGFYNRFNDFISLTPTGNIDPTFDVEIFDYVNVPATFVGGEAEVTFHLLDTDPDSVHFELQADYTRARDRDTGDPLPRISPLRLWAGLVYQGRGLNARLGVKRVEPQHRNAANETETDGYTMLDASLTYQIPIGRQTAEIFVVGSNLTDEQARNAVSFLKDIAPLPGASVRGGVRLSF
jgi:iron complex outermembrane receptor protein